MNHGYDQVRALTPRAVGARVDGPPMRVSIERAGGGYRLPTTGIVERGVRKKPTLVAEVLVRLRE